jgi:RNA recognition motif-containing protein
MNEALLHVGNLPYSIERDDLEAMFLNAGTVVSASLMTYKFDSRSSGYGFVEMASVEMYNGREVRERKLAVNLARPRTASFVKRPES